MAIGHKPTSLVDRGFETYSSLYGYFAGREIPTASAIECAAGHFGPIATVLDLGAGGGELSRRLAGIFRAKFTVVDTSIEAIKRLRETMPFATVVKSSAERFVYKHRMSYDLIMCSHLLYYIRPLQWKKFVYNMNSCLTKTGAIVFVLASEQSSIYNEPNYRCIRQAGRLDRFSLAPIAGRSVFAEDLECLLNDWQRRFSVSSIIWRMLLEPGDLETRAQKIHRIVDVICFLNRVSRTMADSLFPRTLRQCAERLYEQGYLDMIDRVVVVPTVDMVSKSV